MPDSEDNSRVARLEGRLDKGLEQLTAHVAGCTKVQESAERWRTWATGRLDDIGDKLDKIILSRAVESGERRGRASTVNVLWIAVVTACTAGGWLFEHWRSGGFH